MRFEVPQFIEIEDKIFGPFTWKQFVYLGGGVGLAVVLFFIAPTIITIIIGVPIAILASALAFYPVNNRPFSVLLESVWNFYKNNRVYYWRRKQEVVYRGPDTIPQSTRGISIPEQGKSDILSLARKLELEVPTTNQNEE